MHIVATGKDPAVSVPRRNWPWHWRTRVCGSCTTIEGLTGVKFNDSELLGVPTIVVVGKRLVDGMVEIGDRASGQREEVPVAAAVAEVLKACGR